MAPPTAVRIGETTIAPGERRVVAFRLPRRATETSLADALPVFVAVGRLAGPRVVILGAPRGFETQAASVAIGLTIRLSSDQLKGSVVIVPVLRPGGRFAPGGRAVKRSLEWNLPGDVAGAQAARDAATVFSEVIADASLVLVLSQSDPGRAGTLTLRGDLDDPRVRRLAEEAEVPVLVHTAHARTHTRPQDPLRLDLYLPANPASVTETSTTVERLVHAWSSPSGSPRRKASARVIAVRNVTPILAPVGGLLRTTVIPGDIVAKGTTLARLTPPLAPGARAILASHDGLILEVPTRDGARRGAKLFELGRLRGPLARHQTRAPTSPTGGAPQMEMALQRLRPAEPQGQAPTPPTGGAPLRVGWVERVSLPGLGVAALLAKIDTGARTSALHVTRMKVVGSSGLQRRPILEITIPGRVNGGRVKAARLARPASVIRVQVREWARVKDTSGRTERRPVIETTLRIGPLERRIRLTLTDRGDMLYPMLVGRTALGNGVVVDPSQRRLLGEAGIPPMVPRPRGKPKLPKLPKLQIS